MKHKHLLSVILLFVPLLSVALLIWFQITDHNLLASGQGDDGLVVFALLGGLSTIFMLPIVFILNGILAMKSIKAKDSKNTVILLLGIVMIFLYYLMLILNPFHAGQA